ncbi:UDP-N-acetylmuramate dehydrogenase [Longivirga aurantiaca]|uniref:UDP-N-acetylenolpyruvoylglucosamine reductase n=1 Tax=Longivirga aurantiaca TaxID=1837743 RepID=A0ABW1SZB0_9ACTN
MTTLADLTTLRLGGPAARLVVAEDERTLVDAVREADASGLPALVVAGGSNLVVADSGYPGTVVLVRTTGVAVESDLCGGAYVTVAAGEEWDSFVQRAVAEEWAGIECLSGIPGSVGATPVQNVGAYGQEVGSSLARVRTFDRIAGVQRTFMHADLGLGYRTSLLKQEPGHHLVLDVTFQLGHSGTGTPIAYAELARSLGVEVGARAPLADVRAAVLDLRRSKGMVLDAADHDTWSAGSFFTNPLLAADDAARLPADAPRWPADGDRVKTSAAWLIEHAGFAKGYGDGPATLSTKHTLALTNRGAARTDDVLALARVVRDGVRDRFGVTLEPEPVLVGCSLDG